MPREQMERAIRRDVDELLDYGILIVPRRPEHTPEKVAELGVVLNRLLAVKGRSATLSLDRLAMVVTLDPKENV